MRSIFAKLSIILACFFILSACSDSKKWEDYHNNIANKFRIDPKQLWAPTDGPLPENDPGQRYYVIRDMKYDGLRDKTLIAHKNILRVDFDFPGRAYWISIPSVNSDESDVDKVEIAEPLQIETPQDRMRVRSGVISNDRKSLVLSLKSSNPAPHICTITIRGLKVSYAEKLSWFEDPWSRTFRYQHVDIGGGSITLVVLVGFDYKPPRKYFL
jgi:hypothetical protein